jgi:hypothetical protein
MKQLSNAAFRHHTARDGFEVVFVTPLADGYRIDSHTAAIENGEGWVVHATIVIDRDFRARRATIRGQSKAAVREVVLETNGHGAWFVDGVAAPSLDGCLDVDLEASAFTNAFPVGRLGLAIGAEAAAPAAYVRALDLRVERLEQHYRRLSDSDGHSRYAYDSPAFDFRCDLTYDEHGVVVDYPGIATRVRPA